MPFASESQRRFLYSKHPKVAKEFEEHTPSGKLPEKKKKKRSRPLGIGGTEVGAERS
jgi:hypothetical protein